MSVLLSQISIFQDRKPNVRGPRTPCWTHTHTPHLILRPGHQQGDVGVLLLAQDGHCLFPVLDVHTIYLRQAEEQSTRTPELALGWALVEHPGLGQVLELWEGGEKWKVPRERAAWPVREHACSENSMEEEI